MARVPGAFRKTQRLTRISSVARMGSVAGSSYGANPDARVRRAHAACAACKHSLMLDHAEAQL
jgi:hypothetical protein